MVLRKNSSLRIKYNIRSYLAEIDVPLIVAVVALSLISLLNMYGLSQSSDFSYFSRQVVYTILGIFLMVLLSFFNYRYLKNYSLPVVAAYISVILLLSLTFYSKTIRGVNSWIVLGNYTFEPAELAKLIIIIVLAKYFSQRHVHISQFKHIAVSGIYFFIPLVIIIAQPDLGSAIILSLIWFGMLLAAGINKKQLAVIVCTVLVIGALGWISVLKPYQKERIVSFLNPYNDPLGSDYNLIQSQVAIGSGHLFGKGLQKGSQTNLGFLPEPYNDFVFAAAAEQFGVFGIGIITGLILFVLSRILLVGRMTSSNFGKLFSIGMALFIFSHFFVSAGVNVGLMPVTGLPFPFLSYGGSHFISIMIGLGILQSIKRYG